ncbi:hypothetical protein SDC9_93084 [bioreactor metagenome]|uniref:Uncharacterized protein n=1 Tax=bioreactor metagenome TaxID=1076179 RepID=A0A645A9H0_9ZZZZ
MADTFYGSQPEADMAGFVHRELEYRFVDVRRKNIDAHGFALVHKLGDFSDVIQVVRQHRRHIFRWVVCFQPGGLVGNPRITGGMRFIEGVLSKFFPVRPNLLQVFFFVAVGFPSENKFFFQGRHFVRQFLAHGLAQLIRLSPGEIGQQSRQKHHLLLVNRDSIGLVQKFLHYRNIVYDLLFSLLAGDKRRDIIHRAGTVQGIHCNQVFKLAGVKLFQVLLHPG